VGVPPASLDLTLLFLILPLALALCSVDLHTLDDDADETARQLVSASRQFVKMTQPDASPIYVILQVSWPALNVWDACKRWTLRRMLSTSPRHYFWVGR
jgi:hypothetical protein